MCFRYCRALITTSMNTVRRSLREVFACTETEALNSCISALVIRHVSDSRIEISDDGFKCFLDFDSVAGNRYRKLVEVDKTYLFYKVEKKSSNVLQFSKKSFLKIDPTATQETAAVISLKDLVDKQAKEIITSQLIVKVWEVRPVSKALSGGHHTRKLVVGDCDFSVTFTFWNDSIKYADHINVGDVLRLKTFGLDNYEKKGPGQPMDIVYRDRRPMTSLALVPFDQVPLELQELSCSVLDVIIEGTVQQVQDSHSFTSCPGNETRCGKSVKPGSETCDKCKMSIHNVTLIDDYIVTLVVFGADDIYHLKAFQSCLEALEGPGLTPEEKLATLLDKSVKVKAKRSTRVADEIVIENIIVNEEYV